MRNGWVVTWSDGTRWIGDCPVWARKSRQAGHRVERMMIMGRGRWNCGERECG